MLAVLVAAALASPPNVVIISVDTLRADHLGFYGYEYDTSPNLDKLAAGALVFDDMVCEVPLTGPSMTAMMTSRYPRATGVIRNGLRLPGGVPTLAELFRAAGYQTVCVQSNWTLKANVAGLDRGFDVYDEAFHKGRWGVIKAEREGDAVTEAALKLLAQGDAARPLFAWIHYSDPHAPYRHRRKFDVAKDAVGDDPRAAKVIRRYNSEIAFMDHHIAILLDALPKENTFIVFVADHGESLFEHNYIGHGRRIYQNNVHVPFFLHGPGVEPGRTDLPARGVDFAPTVIALAGLPELPGAMGVDLRQPDVLEARARVIETYGGAVPNIPGIKEIMADAGPQRRGVLLEGWKLILDEDLDAELFYLPDDPDELRDLSREQSVKQAELRALIDAWDRSVARAAAQDAPLSDDDIEALRSLGYID